jgi:Zn-dependent peptidase ImmA (M78 family)
MGMIRKGIIGIKAEKQGDEIIDSPQKLLKFARNNKVYFFPLDVKYIANKMGIEVKESHDLSDNISGILEKNEYDKWIIGVNANHHPNRQRYTIAHELGHYCLHRYQERFFEDQVFFRGLESTKTEYQANNFASEILMPEDQFLKFLNNGIKDVEELAKKFGVSTLALRIRAKNLGCTGHEL